MPYDMHKVIEAVVDDGDSFEYAAKWAPNIVCCFARLDGHPVGIVGNQPMHLAGVLDIESSEKAARQHLRRAQHPAAHVRRRLAARRVEEYGGIIRHGAAPRAYCESTVPRIQVVTRRAYGGGTW
jgi:acetyl-CoA carboxylase carboxyltransferase component